MVRIPLMSINSPDDETAPVEVGLSVERARLELSFFCDEAGSDARVFLERTSDGVYLFAWDDVENPSTNHSRPYKARVKLINFDSGSAEKKKSQVEVRGVQTDRTIIIKIVPDEPDDVRYVYEARGRR